MPIFTVYLRRLGKFLSAMILLGAIAIASLWVTSLALEPEGVGVAGAPLPDEHDDAVIQVYGADVWGIRGRFAIHTWVAAKPRNADTYTIYQVIGWRQRRGRPVLAIDRGEPARPWFGSPALLLLDRRGAEAEALIGRIEAAVESYPFPDQYTMWPGPNSNSFVAWIGLEVPELGLDLPAKALGQGWMKRHYEDIKKGDFTGL